MLILVGSDADVEAMCVINNPISAGQHSNLFPVQLTANKLDYNTGGTGGGVVRRG